MPALATMTWDELLNYKLKLHHSHRDIRIDAGKLEDPNLVHKYNRVCQRIEHTLCRIYDELTRREADARRLNMKPY
jgi:hypothetical protein